MPQCGTQIILCDLPVRFDTYKGCSHLCAYCFTRKKADISCIEKGEGPKALRSFIEGNRTSDTAWVDWPIPLHWDGLSDPFQPAERVHRLSLECLKVFAETGYPVVFSTKGRIVVEPEYLELLSRCNAVAQVSMACPSYDELEPGAPPFEERLEIMTELVKVCKRGVARVQPYFMQHHDEIVRELDRIAATGVHGVILEAAKMTRKTPGMEKLGGDYVYPIRTLEPRFQELKERAHALGLAFFSGENRLRYMGDSLTCCGTEGVPGFRACKANLNHELYGEGMEFAPGMEVIGTAGCFGSLCQTTAMNKNLQKTTFRTVMEKIAKTKAARKMLGA